MENHPKTEPLPCPILYNIRSNCKPGRGSDVLITLYLKDRAWSIFDPLYIIFAHELIHAYLYSKGLGISVKRKCMAHKCPYNECYVIGLNHRKNKQWYHISYTENSIRTEHDLVLRVDY